MTWILLIAAVAFFALGVDALLLASGTAPSTERELDEIVVGGNDPPLSEASKDYYRRDIFRLSIALYPQWLGAALILAGLLSGLLAIQLWPGSP